MKRTVPIVTILLSTAAAHAGTVYIPVAKVDPGQGVAYQTQVVFSNTGEVARRATPTIIPLGADGTDRENFVTLPSVSVNGGSTVLVQDLLGGTTQALVEFTTAPQLIASAHLATVLADGTQKLGAAWPIITDSNHTLAGGLAHLQGWERSAANSTDFGLVNLGAEASCDVDVYRADGAQVGHYELTRPALSFAFYTDVLSIVGLTSASQARAQVSCDQPFFAFAVVTDAEDHRHTVILDSALGSSELGSGGGGGGGGGGGACANDGVCFDVAGVFHSVASGARVKIYNAPVAPQTTYASLSLDFDIVFTGWYPQQPSGEHNFFWINRGPFIEPNTYPIWTNNVFGYANSRGTRNRVTLVTNVNQGPNLTTFLTADTVLIPGTQYHIAYTYNHPARTYEMRVSNSGGLVAQIVGRTTGAINTDDYSAFMLYFGNALGHNGNEVPWPNGTQFSNLVYRMNR